MVIGATKVDGTDWHLQAYRPRVDLEEGRQYTLKFKAVADGDVERTTKVIAQVHHDDFHNVGLSAEFKATKQWKDYEFTFTAKNVSLQRKHRLVFIFGNELGTIRIKDLILTAK